MPTERHNLYEHMRHLVLNVLATPGVAWTCSTFLIGGTGAGFLDRGRQFVLGLVKSVA